MISNGKYIDFEKQSQPIIKNVGANNCDVLITGEGEYTAPAPYTGFGNVIVELGIEPLNVSPSTETQVFEKEGGYNPVTVLPVENVLPQNIKYGESILNIEGTYGRCFLPRTVADGVLYRSSIFPDFSGVNTISVQALRYAFFNNNGITSVDLKDVQYIHAFGLTETFKYCYMLTDVDLSGLEEINTTNTWEENTSNGMNGTFYSCTMLENVDISNLRRVIGGSAMFRTFYGCESLVSLDLSNLEYINGLGALQYLCGDCTNLESINFSKLKTIQGGATLGEAFMNCIKLKELSFPALTDDFDDKTNHFVKMLDGCSDVTVHFPSNLESVIGSWTSVLNGFSGTNTTVLFDLPSTEIIDENSEL